MFDIGWSELLVIAVVAIVVVGPKDLPRLMRTFGHYAGKLRRAASDFQRQFEEAMRETELEEVKKAIESVRDETPGIDLKAPIDKPIMVPNRPPAAAPAQTNGKGTEVRRPLRPRPLLTRSHQSESAPPNPRQPRRRKPPRRRREAASARQSRNHRLSPSRPRRSPSRDA